MNSDLKGLLMKIGHDYQNLIEKGSRHYIEVSLARAAGELGFKEAEKQYRHAYAIVPLKRPLKGMKVRLPPVIDFNQLKVGCAMANIYMGVDGNGDVSLCCRGFGPRPEMGNIADGARVYDSGPMKLLRQYVYSENQPLKCSVCYANWTGKH